MTTQKKWSAQVLLFIYILTDRECERSNNTLEYKKGWQDPDAKFKHHCTYWQLCSLPYLTLLIHLTLPLSFTIPSLFQSMILLLFLFLDASSSGLWRMPSSACIRTPPLPQYLSARATPADRCLYFRLLPCPWTVSCPVFDNQDSKILKCMRSHAEPRNKSVHHPQTKNALKPCLRATDV